MINIKKHFCPLKSSNCKCFLVTHLSVSDSLRSRKGEENGYKCSYLFLFFSAKFLALQNLVALWFLFLFKTQFFFYLGALFIVHKHSLKNKAYSHIFWDSTCTRIVQYIWETSLILLETCSSLSVNIHNSSII